jgi:curli production assembly/transport component CsgF
MIAAVSLLSGGAAVAGDLVFGFTNPTFGGNPGNASALLNLAGAQNTFTAPPTQQQSALDKLTTSLQAAMLSKLQSSVTGYVFDGKGNLVNGTQYTAGDYQVTVNVNNGIVSLTTLEISTGNSTVINVGNVNILSQP